MNRVWIVEKGYDYEGSDVQHVCLTEAIAIREAKKMIEQINKDFSWIEANDWTQGTIVGSEGFNIHKWSSQMSANITVYSSEVISK